MKKEMKRTIYLFAIILFLLLGMSLLLMYHSKFINSMFITHFEKQCLWIFIGIIIFIICYFIPSKYWFNFSFTFYLVNLILLLLVLFIGVNTNGSRAWLKIGAFKFQPSEFMKFSYSLYLTSFCTNRVFYTIKDEFKFLIKVFLIFIIPSVLVFLEPDTGAILFLLLITLILLWKTKISRKWFWVFIAIIAIIIGSFFYCYFFQRDFLIKILGTSFFYRVERLFSFGSGMQIENALIALGSCPFISFNLDMPGIYIPEAPTDFIFALSSNVFGLIGPIFILICYLILDFCLIKIWKMENDKKRNLFLTAFIGIFIFSQIENIGMNLGILPIIGIPLPFLSYGGSCMIVFFAFLGIIFQYIKSFTKNSKTLKINYR